MIVRRTLDSMLGPCVSPGGACVSPGGEFVSPGGVCVSPGGDAVSPASAATERTHVKAMANIKRFMRVTPYSELLIITNRIGLSSKWGATSVVHNTR